MRCCGRCHWVEAARGPVAFEAVIATAATYEAASDCSWTHSLRFPAVRSLTPVCGEVSPFDCWE